MAGVRQPIAILGLISMVGNEKTTSVVAMHLDNRGPNWGGHPASTEVVFLTANIIFADFIRC